MLGFFKNVGVRVSNIFHNGRHGATRSRNFTKKKKIILVICQYSASADVSSVIISFLNTVRMRIIRRRLFDQKIVPL